LTDTGVYYEVHFDGHEKLNFKALRMGSVGIVIYGSRYHSSSKMIKFPVVPNARCSSTVGHYYLDLVEENGGKFVLRVWQQLVFISLPSFCSGSGGRRVRNRRTICGACRLAVHSVLISLTEYLLNK
jgi:hypothetical protein